VTATALAQCKVAEGVGTENQIAVGLRSEAGNLMQLDYQPAFVVTTISPNSTGFLAYSTHTVSISTNADVVSYQHDPNLPGYSTEPTPSLLITGLNGTLTPSNASLPLGGPSQALFQGRRAVWNRTEGSLLLVFADRVTLPAFAVATVTFEMQNLGVPNVAANVRVRLDGALPISEVPMAGVALQSLAPANFTSVYVNSTSRVRSGPNTISVFLVPSTDIQPLSNITISGLLGSSTAPTMNLSILGPIANYFSAPYYVNRTNTSSGYVKNGVIRGESD
jgi:hypothetical protein